MTTGKISAILDFWFEGVDDDTPIDRKALPFRKWFTSTRAFDEEIRSFYKEDLLKAAAGEYKDWERAPRGKLALVLLYDQFSRNMFRGTPQMYAYDALALELALRSIRDGDDKKLGLIERVFLYMPLMHSQSPGAQEQSVACFEMLAEESRTRSLRNVSYYEYHLKHARQHQETISKFGCFPHRARTGRSEPA